VIFCGWRRFGVGVIEHPESCDWGALSLQDRFVVALDIVTEAGLKIAMHLLSQSCLIEIRDPEASGGKMCAVRADGGSWGSSSSVACVDCKWEPSGSMTVMPGLATCLLQYGALLARKCPVAPVLAMMGVVVVAVGGLFGGEEASDNGDKSSLDILLLLLAVPRS
jgi:hypothetical protein